MTNSKHPHKADDLLIRTKESIDKSYKHFTTDGLAAYTNSSKKIFGEDVLHHAHIHLKRDVNNNKM